MIAGSTIYEQATSIARFQFFGIFVRVDQPVLSTRSQNIAKCRTMFMEPPSR